MTVRSRRGLAAGPVLDVHEAFRHGYAKADARAALDACEPGTPEAVAAARALAQLVVRRLIRWPGQGDQVLAALSESDDEAVLRAVVAAVDDHYREAVSR